MATVLEPRRAELTRPQPRSAPTDRGRRKLRNVDELDGLSSAWRRALDAAQTALQSAPAVLHDEPLRGRSTLLKAERTQTAHLLEDLAHDFQVKAWLSDLEVPAWNMYRLLGLPEHVEACVFDLEDVLTGSPALHVAAWSETFNALASERGGREAEHFAPFDPRRDYFEHLRARPRLDGVRAFLASRGIRLPEGGPDDPPGCQTVHALANLKQQSLLRRLHAGGLSAFAGSRRYLQLARRAGLRCAAVSASANTQTILEQTELAELINATIDGTVMLTQGLRSSPAPDVPLAACWQLDVRPDLTAAFASTAEGVASGRAAGLALVVGIGEPSVQPSMHERGADVVAGSLRELLDRRLVAAR